MTERSSNDETSQNPEYRPDREPEFTLPEAHTDRFDFVVHRTPKPGDEMPDGTILAGNYFGKPLYTTPADAPLTYTFNQAAEYADQLNAQKFLGHDDWRVPTKGELNVVYESRNKGKLKGTFDETGSGPAGWYWSSSRNYTWGAVEVQRFGVGGQDGNDECNVSSLRCVR